LGERFGEGELIMDIAVVESFRPRRVDDQGEVDRFSLHLMAGILVVAAILQSSFEKRVEVQGLVRVCRMQTME
jgi:hypothetical protein